MINWKVRFKNPVFIGQIVMAIIMPILTYYGLTVQDLTTWAGLGHLLVDAFSSPYIVGLIIINVWGVLNDPTTKGFGDSVRALGYDIPN